MSTLFSLFASGNAPATLLFRDYARGDLAESRFSVRKRAWDEPHLLSAKGLPYYRRGDGTMTFFFDEEYLRPIAQEAIAAQGGSWDEELNIVERVGENRKKGLVLTRRFLQGSWTRRVQ